MRTVVVSEPGTRIIKRSGRLFLLRGGETVRKLRLQELGQLVLMGPVDLSHGALMALLAREADVVWMTGAGRYRARLVGRLAGNVELRRAQYARMSDPDFALRLCKAIVEGKVANQRTLMLRAQRRLAHPEMAVAVAEMRRLGGMVERAASPEVVRGLEGRAAAVYFGAFGRMLLDPRFRFERRTRRPPTDPVNACLSLGYTVLVNEMESLVYRAGLDPMAGYFHVPERGRPSLVLDLVEELRPVAVDQVVLRLFNRRQFGPHDFGPPEGEEDDPLAVLACVPGEETGDHAAQVAGADAAIDADGQARAVHLRGPARKVFLGALYRRLRERVIDPARGLRCELRDIMREQVYRAARVIEGREAGYVPYEAR